MPIDTPIENLSAMPSGMPVASQAIFSTTLGQNAMRIARRWKSVPESVSDEDALRQGFISPEMLEMLMAMLMEMLTGCLNQGNRAQGFKRIRAFFSESNRFAVASENAALARTADKWIEKFGLPRQRGDLIAIREAIKAEASDMEEAEYNELQVEAVFLTT